MTILIILLAASLIWSAYQIENAPLLSKNGDFIYKDHVTFLGLKVYKRKK